MQYSPRRAYLAATFILAAVLSGCSKETAQQEVSSAGLAEQVKGLWIYTGLTTSDGEDLPLDGVFLFRDDMFVQQAVFKNSPISEQRALAHAGPYRVDPESIHLIAEQTISTSPLEQPHLTFRPNTEHDLTVSRSVSELKLVFSMGTGTVQEFTLAGTGAGVIHRLEDGVFAIADEYFILVQGNDDGSVSGYGTYRETADGYELSAAYWTEASQAGSTNYQDYTVSLQLDDAVLRLADGRVFPLKR